MEDRDPGSGLKGAINRKLDEFGLTQTDYVKAALKWQYNWIGLAGAAAFAVVSGSGLPIVLAAGVELMYVALVPQSSRFRRLVRSWKFAADKRAHEQRLSAIFHELPPELRTRYSQVDEVARTIRVNYGKLSSTSQMFVGQIDQKLNGLLDGYVRLLHAGHSQRDHLQLANPGDIQREIDALEKALPKETPRVQEINRKRIEILRKRVEKFAKIRENRKVIDAQCAAIEDVLHLIRDQSVTMRDPEEVSHQLDHLVQDVENTESTVREVEAIFGLAAPDSDFGQVSDAPHRQRAAN